MGRMKETTAKATRHEAAAEAEAAQFFAAMSNPAIEAFRRTGEAALKTTRDLNEAYIDYTSHCTEQAMEMARSVMGEGSWNGTLEKQRDYASAQFKYNLEQSSKIFQMLTEGMRGISMPWSEFLAKSAQNGR